jgi:hypothetical protein
MGALFSWDDTPSAIRSGNADERRKLSLLPHCV